MRYVLAATCIVALSACAGAPPTLASASAQSRAASWIVPAASHQILVYITSVPYIYVFSYPQGAAVGEIHGNYPYGLCANGGDVFVVDPVAQEIFVYAHGASKPKLTLAYPEYDPTQCAVDPTTGNLVVISGTGADRRNGSSYFDVYLYVHGKGQPKLIVGSGLDYMEYPAYDAVGDLFISGEQGGPSFALVELLKGKTAFRAIELDEEIRNRIKTAGGIAWAAGHLAVSASLHYPLAAIDRITLTGAKAHFAAQTTLGDSTGTSAFFIEDGDVIAPENDNAYLWRYPRGGKPIGTFGVSDGTGVVLSLPPS